MRQIISTEPRLTSPADAGRVADFIIAWLKEREYGLNLPSRRVLAARVEAFARSRPGCQLYWEHDDGLHATCSIQRRATGSGAQALVQLRVGDDSIRHGAIEDVVDRALAHAAEVAPEAEIAVLLPNGDPVESQLVARGFSPLMALVTMTRALRDDIVVNAPPEVIIRPLVPGLDEDAYASVQHDAFSSDPLGSGLTADDIRHQIDLGIARPSDFFLAMREGTLVGVARSLFDGDGLNPDGGPFAEILGNGVLESYRRHGIGQALMRAQSRHLRDLGATSACLTVLSARPELVAHYAKIGFDETGRQTIWSRTQPDQ
ncbi:MAG: GNAT family N-acetyltransferase [Chloroflexota bacterium]|nr:MAG: GNAT family N-acetyltransferase [Chloroflexota bacterium]